MPTFLRYLSTFLLGALVVLVVYGWMWTAHGPNGPSPGARAVLVGAGLAAVVGLVGIWSVGRERTN